MDYRKRHRTVEQMSQPNVRERGETVTSIRQAAAVRNVSPAVVRRWMLIVPVRGAQVDFERRRSGALPTGNPRIADQVASAAHRYRATVTLRTPCDAACAERKLQSWHHLLQVRQPLRQTSNEPHTGACVLTFIGLVVLLTP